MTTPHKLDPPDDSFVVGDGWQWGQNLDPDVVGLLTMGGILPDPNNIFGTMRSWLGNLPVQVLEIMFRPLLPLSTDADWVDTPTAVNTILGALPLQQLQQFWDWVKNTFDPVKKVLDDLILVLSGVLVNPGGILQPVADLLGGVVQGLKDLVTGIIGLFGGSGSTVADAVAAISGWLGGTFKNLSDGLAGVVKTVQDFLDGLFAVFGGTAGIGKTVTEVLAQITGWLGGAFKAVQDGVTAITGIVQSLLDAIFGLFGGTAGVNKTVAEAIAAMTGWFGTTFKAVADGLAALVKKVQDLFDGIWRLFTGNTTGAGKDLATTLGAISSWLNTVFKPVKDGLTAVVDTVQALLDTIFSLFGGIDDTGKTITDAVTALTGWFGNFQKLLDALFGAFGGIAGTDKTIADVIGAITGWFTNVFQKLMDEIAKLWGWTPGAGGAAIHAGITDVVATISGILGIGQSAAVSAANANAGLAAIAAGQKGGFFDEFELPIANDLPATDWKKTSTLADSYGTDGSGSAVFRPSGIANGWVEYVQISKPLLVPDMRCGVTLSRLPTWNTISIGGLNQSSWRIKVQCNPTDLACFQVEIAYDQARFESVNASGAITTLGAWQKIPPNALGTQYELEIKGNVLTLHRGGIQAATYSGVTPMSGRCVGFGAEKIQYGILDRIPCINLAGVSWRPVT